MEVVKKRVLFACTAILMPLVTIHAAHACDCIGPSTVALQIDMSTIAGIFRLRSIEKTAIGPDNPYTVYRPKFTVEKVFKGPLKVGDEWILSPPRTKLRLAF